MVIFDGFSQQLPDIDPTETAEWVDSLEMVADERGRTRARFLLMKMLERARPLPCFSTTASKLSTHSPVWSGSMSGTWWTKPSMIMQSMLGVAR